MWCGNLQWAVHSNKTIFHTCIFFFISEILSRVAAASSFRLCLTESMTGTKCSVMFKGWMWDRVQEIGELLWNLLCPHRHIFKSNEVCMRPKWGTVFGTKYCHNLKPEWTAATPKVRFSKSTNLKQSNIVGFHESDWAPESSIFDHLSKFLLRWKLPYALHQVLIGVPVPSEHLKCCWCVFCWAQVSRISGKRGRDTLPIGGMIWKE